MRISVDKVADLVVECADQVVADHCDQMLGYGDDRVYCANPATHDLETDLGYIGAFCDTHYLLVLEAMS